jgi:hypothetical protein
MPITVVTTPGAASANSYATLNQADAIADELLPVPLPWLQAEVDIRNRAVVTATRDLDELHFVGERVDAVQALEWPRSGAMKPGLWTYYLTTDIPAALTRACTLLAIWRVGQGQTVDPAVADAAGLASISFGSELALAFEQGATSQSPLGDFVNRVMRPTLRGLVYAGSQFRTVRG